MDVTTGEIKQFKSDDHLQAAMASGKWEELAKQPDRKCKRCYGRGHTGKDLTTNLYVVCPCVKIPKPQETKDDN